MLHIFYSLSLESLWAKNIYFFVKQSLSFVINCLKFLDLQNPKVNPLVLPNKGTLNNCRPSTVSWFKSKGHEFLPTKKQKRNKKKPQQKKYLFLLSTKEYPAKPTTMAKKQNLNWWSCLEDGCFTAYFIRANPRRRKEGYMGPAGGRSVRREKAKWGNLRVTLLHWWHRIVNI